MTDRFPRIWSATIALLVTAAILLQVWIAIRVAAKPPGHAVGTLAGTMMANRLLRLFSFFTIQSNILSGVTSAQLARRPDRDGRGWRPLRLAALFGITVTGIVYGTVLAKVHEPHGWQETSANAIVHYIVPVMMVLGWLMFGPRPRIDRRTLARAIVFPVTWFGYILRYGVITKWYPYPFVDVITHGYLRVFVNAVAVVAVFVTVAALYWAGDRRLRRAPRGSVTPPP